MFHSKTHDFLADNRGKTKIYNKHMQKGLVIQDMRYRSLLVLLLVIIIAAGCGNNEDASAPAESSVALTSDTVEQKDETTDEIQETPALNDDVSNTYSTELKDDSSAEDSAGSAAHHPAAGLSVFLPPFTPLPAGTPAAFRWGSGCRSSSPGPDSP